MGERGYHVLAGAFLEEGVDTVFVLTGDGNMYWEAAMAGAGARSVHVRHEHCACAMATGYARITDGVGVASVTCGPGVTQISTALATAAEARVPLVVFAGESPMHQGWYNQQIDQGPIVTATGARYIGVHSARRLQESVAVAFHTARTERVPVVIGVPFDLQQEKVEAPAYRPSSGYASGAGPRSPLPEALRAVAERVAAARRVVVLGGLGAKRAGAADACRRLAELVGGALATTLPARGLFAGDPREIGVAGGFSHPVTVEAFGASDLVLAVGAGLNGYTTNGGKLIAPGEVIQIDDAPAGMVQGRRAADMVLAADARLGVEALIAALPGGAERPDWGVAEYARRLRREPVDATEFEVPEGTTDPREVIRVLDHELPKDWGIVNGSGHCSYFAVHMFDRPAEGFLTIREFGPIGNGLSYAMAMAVARPERPTVLIEGDGGLMMHAQELDTVRREGWKMLLCILNDGAFGSEIHKLRAEGISDHGAVYGHGDLARMAEGFGLRGAVVRDVAELPGRIAEFEAGEGAMLLDIRISDRVVSPRMASRIRRA